MKDSLLAAPIFAKCGDFYDERNVFGEAARAAWEIGIFLFVSVLVYVSLCVFVCVFVCEFVCEFVCVLVAYSYVHLYLYLYFFLHLYLAAMFLAARVAWERWQCWWR